MEAGAAERAARGQRRERVTDWPLMGASEYKHVVLGPIFLKYVEDAIDERRAALRDELAADGITSDATEELLESRDEYTAGGVFWVTPEARWQYLNQRAKQPEIGKLIDNAMDLIEVDNPSLRCMVPKTYARPSLDVRRIGELGEGHPGPCLRVLPRLVRLRRGQGPRRVLHSSVRRQAACGGAGAHEQASVRRVLRLRRRGRAGRAVRRSPRRPAPSCCPHRARALTPVPAAPRLTPGRAWSTAAKPAPRSPTQ